MVAQPSLPLINLVMLTMATLFYGMYFIIFVTSMQLLFGKARESGKYLPLLKTVVFISGCALFLAITAHWITTTVSTFQGFIYFQGGQSANVYFSDNGRATETLGDIFLGLSVLIGDSMIIYRLLVVWCYRKVVIIIPVLSMVGLLSMVYFHWPMILLIGTTMHVKSIALDTGLIPSTVFTLVTNVYCTVFIAWEIWRITSKCQVVGGLNLRNFLAILVESAAIYTSWVIYFTTCHQLDSNLQYVALGALPAVVGITNGLIHVRVGLGRTIEQMQMSGSNGSTTGLGSSLVTGPIRFVPPSSSRLGSGETTLERSSV
ncbi:hypothetical protein B0H13DRAFT_2435896 [Mycena leptocephala]|nr:hypothetical protein B0H13DRAFT_2435896 [Mycena leptocephala]